MAARTKNNAMHAVSVAVRQYANGVNKGTLSANVAKVEAKEKELAAAKAAAKVLLIPIPFLPHYHPSITPARAHCFLQGFCAKEMGVPDWPRANIFWGGEGRGFGLALARLRWKTVSFRRELGNHEEPGGHADGSR